MTMQSEKIDALVKALLAAQKVMENAPLNKVNPHFKSKYSDLVAIREATLPHLHANGLIITQQTMVGDHGFVLVTRLMHESGQRLESTYPLPTNGKPQEIGSALTYARRYSWASMCGITAEEDDDANAAQQAGNGNRPNGNGRAETGELISEDQVKEIWAKLEETQADIAKFCAYFKIDSVPALKASQYDAALSAIDASAKKRKAA